MKAAFPQQPMQQIKLLVARATAQLPYEKT
jgi:hypothetical protein